MARTLVTASITIALALAAMSAGAADNQPGIVRSAYAIAGGLIGAVKLFAVLGAAIMAGMYALERGQGRVNMSVLLGFLLVVGFISLVPDLIAKLPATLPALKVVP